MIHMFHEMISDHIKFLINKLWVVLSIIVWEQFGNHQSIVLVNDGLNWMTWRKNTHAPHDDPDWLIGGNETGPDSPIFPDTVFRREHAIVIE